MTSVIFYVFMVQLVSYIIGNFLAKPINDFVWLIYTKLPVPGARQAESNANLRREVVRLQREMNAVSAQDNFAKWARLRRDYDKTKDKYEKESRGQQQFRSRFDSTVGTLRFIIVQVFGFSVNAQYGKHAMFWLPKDWLPYQVEWCLSLPRAPLGSVSVNIWGVACGTAIGLVSDALVSLFTSKAIKGQKGASGEGSSIAAKSEKVRNGTKKEL